MFDAPPSASDRCQTDLTAGPTRALRSIEVEAAKAPEVIRNGTYIPFSIFVNSFVLQSEDFRLDSRRTDGPRSDDRLTMATLESRDQLAPEASDETEALADAAPQTFNELRDLIVEKRDKLPKRLAQVAAYTIEFPDDIAFGTVGSISERAAVQPSTLVRFAKALGYSGFSELQAVFQQRLRDRPNNYEARLQAFDEHTSGHSQAAARSVERFRERIRPESLDAAARILAEAETVYLIGLRRSYPVTSYLSYALGTLGVRTVLAGSPGGVDKEIFAFAGPRDAALAVSFTPYAQTTVEFTRQVVAQNTPLVAITDSPFSPLALNTAVWFEIVESDFEGFRTLAASMTLAAALAVAVGERRRAAGKRTDNSESV